MRRSRLQIFAEILQAAKNGTKKFSIMRSCNLNYTITEEHLGYLLETDLLEMGASYHTTEKGLKYLKYYRTLDLLLNSK